MLSKSISRFYKPRDCRQLRPNTSQMDRHCRQLVDNGAPNCHCHQWRSPSAIVNKCHCCHFSSDNRAFNDDALMVSLSPLLPLWCHYPMYAKLSHVHVGFADMVLKPIQWWQWHPLSIANGDWMRYCRQWWSILCRYICDVFGRECRSRRGWRSLQNLLILLRYVLLM